MFNVFKNNPHNVYCTWHIADTQYIDRVNEVASKCLHFLLAENLT